MEPLASKFRPSTLDDFIGQEHLVGENGTVRKLMESNSIPSMIFWGPPGTGKTTLAHIISQDLMYDFYKLQAVNSGKSKLNEIIEIATRNSQYNKKTILFLDEIHRWNKSQQDALLPHVENGLIILIGATTENPSFTINNALLSRCRVFIFNQHSEELIESTLLRITKSEYPEIKLEKESIPLIANIANGDLRSAINILEISISLLQSSKEKLLSKEIIAKTINKNFYYDKKGEEHYNLISALHKSMRSSDLSASIYWTARMLHNGEDPLYVARRLLRFSSEDIGNSDPNALILANSVYDACHKLGMPECEVHLIQLATYLAKAPKDNSAYRTVNEAKEDINQYGNLPVPNHLLNAPTKLMKDLKFGEGYVYDHDLKDKKSGQQCLPDKIKDRVYL